MEPPRLSSHAPLWWQSLSVLCCSPSHTWQWLCVPPHLPLSIPFLPSLTSLGPSPWLSPLFDMCTASLFTCWVPILSFFLKAFLFSTVISNPCQELHLVLFFFSFSLRRKPCRVLILYVPPSCCSKLTYVRAMLCCKVLICRQL